MEDGHVWCSLLRANHAEDTPRVSADVAFRIEKLAHSRSERSSHLMETVGATTDAPPDDAACEEDFPTCQHARSMIVTHAACLTFYSGFPLHTDETEVDEDEGVPLPGDIREAEPWNQKEEADGAFQAPKTGVSTSKVSKPDGLSEVLSQIRGTWAALGGAPAYNPSGLLWGSFVNESGTWTIL